jgi:hypothetical protein
LEVPIVIILIEFNVPEVVPDHPAKIPVSDGIALNMTTIPLLNGQFTGEVVTVPHLYGYY